MKHLTTFQNRIKSNDSCVVQCNAAHSAYGATVLTLDFLQRLKNIENINHPMFDTDCTRYSYVRTSGASITSRTTPKWQEREKKKCANMCPSSKSNTFFPASLFVSISSMVQIILFQPVGNDTDPEGGNTTRHYWIIQSKCCNKKNTGSSIENNRKQKPKMTWCAVFDLPVVCVKLCVCVCDVNQCVTFPMNTELVARFVVI